jgi:hypothetical protein
VHDHVQRKSREREAREKEHDQNQRRDASEMQPAEHLVERAVRAVPTIWQCVIEDTGANHHREPFYDGNEQHEKDRDAERPCLCGE